MERNYNYCGEFLTPLHELKEFLNAEEIRHLFPLIQTNMKLYWEFLTETEQTNCFTHCIKPEIFIIRKDIREKTLQEILKIFEEKLSENLNYVPPPFPKQEGLFKESQLLQSISGDTIISIKLSDIDNIRKYVENESVKFNDFTKRTIKQCLHNLSHIAKKFDDKFADNKDVLEQNRMLENENRMLENENRKLEKEKQCLEDSISFLSEIGDKKLKDNECLKEKIRELESQIIRGKDENQRLLNDLRLFRKKHIIRSILFSFFKGKFKKNKEKSEKS